MATFLVRDLVKQPTIQWSEDKLIQLPNRELIALCALTGLSGGGTKAQLIDRLIILTKLQRRVRPYHPDLDQAVTPAQVQALATAYKGDELTRMCKSAKLFYSLNKYGKAAILIQWSRSTLRIGRESYITAKKIRETRTTQQWLF